mgnify:FL=1
MVISYFGEGCFRLQSGDTSLLVDPVSNRLKADVTLKTLVPANVEGPAEGEIVFPGEYEIKGMEIQGWPAALESTAKFVKTVYLVRWEEMSFVFLGHLSKALEPDAMESIGDPDVLFLPFDGEHFLSLEAASKIAKQLNPHFIIPSFSKKPAELLKSFGQKAEAQEKLVFKRKDLSGTRGKIVLLEAR